MPLPPEITVLLRRVRGVLAWQRALRWGAAALLTGAIASVVVSAVKIALPVSLPATGVIGAGLAAALLVVVAGRLAPGLDYRLVARLADTRLALKDRLSTAVDLTAGRVAATTLAPRAMDDAAQAARGADVRGAFRITAPRLTRWAVPACLAALALGLWTPGLTIPGTPAGEVAERIRREGRRLERVGRRLEEQARVRRVPATRRIAPRVQSLGLMLRQERLERAEALARVHSLGRQVDAARRELAQRMREGGITPPPRGSPEFPFRPAQQLERQIRELRELAARLAQEEGGARQDLAQRLNEFSQEGEGPLPAEARRKVEEARRQTQRGDFGGAGESLAEALQELEGLRSVLEDERVLAQTQRDLEQSAQRIARGAAGGSGQSEEENAGTSPQRARPAPGERPPRQDPEAESAAAPTGPNEGSQPGRGRGQEKLGAPTGRSAQRGERGSGRAPAGSRGRGTPKCRRSWGPVAGERHDGRPSTSPPR